MTQPSIGIHTGRRLVVAFALFVLALLSLGCEMKKVAPPQPAHEKRYFSVAKLQAGGGGGGGDHSDVVGYSLRSPGIVQASFGDAEGLANRKLIRNGLLELLVGDVGQCVSKIGSIVSGAG